MLIQLDSFAGQIKDGLTSFFLNNSYPYFRNSLIKLTFTVGWRLFVFFWRLFDCKSFVSFWWELLTDINDYKISSEYSYRGTVVCCSTVVKPRLCYADFFHRLSLKLLTWPCCHSGHTVWTEIVFVIYLQYIT